MKYHAPTNAFTFEHDRLQGAAYALLYAMRKIREISDLPLTRYTRDDILTDADHAQKSIIDAANALGIDLDAKWGNDLDLTDA